MSLDPVAVGVPKVRVANSAFNGARTIELMEKAEGEKTILALFPELGLSAYLCDYWPHDNVPVRRLS